MLLAEAESLPVDIPTLPAVPVFAWVADSPGNSPGELIGLCGLAMAAGLGMPLGLGIPLGLGRDIDEPDIPGDLADSPICVWSSLDWPEPDLRGAVTSEVHKVSCGSALSTLERTVVTVRARTQEARVCDRYACAGRESHAFAFIAEGARAAVTMHCARKVTSVRLTLRATLSRQ
jgi:hypothetical protein